MAWLRYLTPFLLRTSRSLYYHTTLSHHLPPHTGGTQTSLSIWAACFNLVENDKTCPAVAREGRTAQPFQRHPLSTHGSGHAFLTVIILIFNRGLLLFVTLCHVARGVRSSSSIAFSPLQPFSCLPSQSPDGDVKAQRLCVTALQTARAGLRKARRHETPCSSSTLRRLSDPARYRNRHARAYAALVHSATSACGVAALSPAATGRGKSTDVHLLKMMRRGMASGGGDSGGIADRRLLPATHRACQPV